ncbi:MAG: SemiSWEET transporter [Bacteroidota bacterium]
MLETYIVHLYTIIIKHMDTITIIGLVAATCTTISFLPQAMRIIKTKHTKDLSLAMYSIFTTGIFLWLVYGILIKDLPLITSNAITFLLTSTILILKIKYK